MTKLGRTNAVGSQDILTVFHYPGGWRAVRSSEKNLNGQPLNPPFSITCYHDTTTMLQEYTFKGEYISSRFFKSISIIPGRKFPEILHYLLEEEEIE